jgi:hypothetical protein
MIARRFLDNFRRGGTLAAHAVILLANACES